MMSMSNTRLDNKTALVNGASGGIGAAVATRLAAEGAAVVLGYHRNAGAAERLAAELAAEGARTATVRADASDPEQCAFLVDRAASLFGPLDILVSCAGIEHFDTIDALGSEAFDRIFAINTRGQLLLAKHTVAHMRAGGRVILTSSISAQRAVFGHTLYAASKAA
ncbi:MAG: SDR family NAD(P)-dependent oxidoreductase, partial [Kutzneria sp.]|nr:SDR family NAD(P)-dependent oxidoreductase [Kutzneria sp.]